MDFIHDPNLVLYLPLYELDGSSFMSKDAYRHLCTVTGATLYPSRGRYFISDDLISVPDHSALDITGRVTIEAWVMWTGPSLKGNVLDEGFDNTALPLRFADMDAATEKFGWYSSSSGWKKINYSTFSLNNWHHIAMTYDKAHIIIWKNTEKVAALAETGAMPTNNKALTIGCYNNQNNINAQFLRGLVGEIRIYNRALSPAEIQHNYLATKWRYR